MVKKGDYVSVIGCSNMDILGFSKEELTMYDSNPGFIDMSPGGVGRNIAENLAKLSLNVNLLSAIGNDLNGTSIINHCNKVGIETRNIRIIDEIPTSVYLSILNKDNDMQLAISHMDISSKIDITYIEKHLNILENSSVIVVDTNLEVEVIEYVLKKFQSIPIFVDTVSSHKCNRILKVLDCIHTLKTNKIEVETLTGIKITNESSLVECTNLLREKGVNNIYITLGKDGVFVSNNEGNTKFESLKAKNIVNSNGAGDSFCAGLVYSYLNNFDLENTIMFSQAASVIALSHKETINPQLSVDYINEIIGENKNVR